MQPWPPVLVAVVAVAIGFGGMAAAVRAEQLFLLGQAAQLASYEPRHTTQGMNLASQVAAFYRRHLNREPDEWGLRYYVKRVQEGTMTVADVERAILRSPERVALLATGMTRAQVIANLAPEYRKRYGRDPSDLEIRPFVQSVMIGIAMRVQGAIDDQGRLRTNVPITYSTTTQTTPSPAAPSADQTSPPVRNDRRTTFANLSAIAQELQSGTALACYDTVVAQANRAGAPGNGDTWPETLAYRGRELASGLRAAIADGTLKPGMVVWMNSTPGSDPRSLHDDNYNHWMTYLGPDGSGVPRFSDQYRTDFTVEALAAAYGSNRVIDRFFDPYA